MRENDCLSSRRRPTLFSDSMIHSLISGLSSGVMSLKCQLNSEITLSYGFLAIMNISPSLSMFIIGFKFAHV